MSIDSHISQIAERIRELRAIEDVSAEEMARLQGMSAEEYSSYERGEKDFSVTFLYNCATRFGVDMTELLTGDNPHLTTYTVVRRGEGLPIKRREQFAYQHLAFRMKNRIADPFLVTAKFSEADSNGPISTSIHDGQEMDYIISGTLKITVGGHVETLREGDCIYYDSSRPHGMVAVEGRDCDFLAVVMK